MTTISKTPEQGQSVTLRQMLPILGASTLGTAIEWYDFFIYNTASALVFPALFFPKFSPFAGVLLALTTNLVGFAARPLGGIIFGHLGDRIGRKSLLIVTLLLMGISTFVIGFLPGYSAIGIAAPLLVSLLRFCQGLGVGGEWGGSVLLALEHAHQRNRGFWSSWPQAGVPIGLVLASISISVFSGLSGNQFSDWGWRVPFFLSAVLVLISLYVRLRITETPLFTKLQEEKQLAKAPVVEAVVQNWKDILLSAGSRFVEQAPFYLFSTYILIYGVAALHLSKQLLLGGIYVGGLAELLTIPIFSYLSDRLGRQRWYLGACVVTAAFAVPYFLLLNTRNPVLVVTSVAISLAICHAALYGPQAALIAERFSTRLRYSGASLGYQLASPFAGGLAPLIAAALFQAYSSFLPIAFYIIAMALISFLAVLGLKDMTRKSIVE